MAKRKLKFGDIVRVDWRDACGRDGWGDPAKLPEDGALLTSTIGFFLKQSKYGIYLAALVNQDNNVNGANFVPKGMILKTTRIAARELHRFSVPRRKGKK